MAALAGMAALGRGGLLPEVWKQAGEPRTGREVPLSRMLVPILGHGGHDLRQDPHPVDGLV